MGLISRVSLDRDSRALIIDLSEPYKFIVNLPHQPNKARSIIFKHVSKDFNCSNLEVFYKSVRSKLNREESIVFLTAANIEEYLHITDNDLEVIATVGLEIPVCPGSYPIDRFRPSTINIAVLLNHPLSDCGLLDLFKTITEAKSLAATELSLRCNHRSPGTVTDAIAVGRPVSLNPSIDFAGMATSIGGRVASIIYSSLVKYGLSKIGLNGFISNNLGLDLESIIDITMRAYSQAPIPGVDEGRVKSIVENILKDVLLDPNVQAIIVAARELDLHASIGSIPSISVDDFKSDSVRIIADELLASALSLYIAGFRGLLGTYWVERLKTQGLINAKLPVFEDDILSAIVGSTLSILYSRMGGRFE